MIERVFYTRGIAPRRGLGAAVGPTGGSRSGPARGGQGWSPRDLPDTCPRGPPGEGAGGPRTAPRAPRSVGGRGRGVPGAAGTELGPTPARPALLSAEHPQGTAAVRVCAGSGWISVYSGLRRKNKKNKTQKNNPEKKKKSNFHSNFFSPSSS